MQAAQGNGFMSNYSVTFLQTVGIKDEYKISVLLVFTNTMASSFAFYFADKLGRRVLILVSTVVMAIGMFAIAGVTGFGKTSNPGGALAGLFIWQVFQAVGWSSWYVIPSSLERIPPWIVADANSSQCMDRYRRGPNSPSA